MQCLWGSEAPRWLPDVPFPQSLLLVSLTRACSEQQSFGEATYCLQVLCWGGPGVYGQPPTVRELSLVEGSPIIRLADGMTKMVGGALNGEPRGWDSPYQATGIKGRILKITVIVITMAWIFLSTDTVPGALLSPCCASFHCILILTDSYPLHFADEETEAQTGSVTCSASPSS